MDLVSQFYNLRSFSVNEVMLAPTVLSDVMFLCCSDNSIFRAEKKKGVIELLLLLLSKLNERETEKQQRGLFLVFFPEHVKPAGPPGSPPHEESGSQP